MSTKGAAVVSNDYKNAHALVDKGDPRTNGPYLDDIRAEQEAEYRNRRMAELNKDDAKPTKKAVAKKAATPKPKKATSSTAKKAVAKKTAKKVAKKAAK